MLFHVCYTVPMTTKTATTTLKGNAMHDDILSHLPGATVGPWRSHWGKFQRLVSFTCPETHGLRHCVLTVSARGGGYPAIIIAVDGRLVELVERVRDFPFTMASELLIENLPDCCTGVNGESL